MRVRWVGIITLIAILIAGFDGGAEAQAPSRLGFDGSGHFSIHGTPRFLRGVYDSGGSSFTDPSAWESYLFLPGGDVFGTRGLAGTNINTYLNYWRGQDNISQLDAALTTLQKYDALWLQTANCFQGRSYTGIAFSVDQPPAGELAGRLAQNAQMAGYYVMDECYDSGYGGVNLVPETQQHYATLKTYDPQGIVMAVPIALGYRDPKLWTQPATGGPTADLFGTDPYPLYNAEPAGGYPHFEVADYIARLRDSVSPDKPIVGVLQLFKFTSNSRLPSYAEMRMHAYSAIVEGAQGLFWWDIGVNGLRKSAVIPASDVAQWSGYLKTLVNELAALEPALLAPATPSALVGNSSSTGDPVAWRKSVLQRDMTLVQPLSYSTYQWYQAELNALNAGNTSLSPMLRQPAPQSGNIRTRTSIVNGIGYVIAYNYTNLPATVTLTWQQPVSQVAVIGEGRTVASSNGSFTDSFGPYDVHVYQIAPDTPPVSASITNPSSGATVSGTATVSVSATGGASPYSYKIAVDGTTVYAGANATTSWLTTSTANGSHTITATVTDASSPAKSATASIPVTVNNLPSLTASFTSPASGATVSGSAAVGMADTGASGSSTFTLAIDGTTVSTQTVSGSSASYAWDTTKAANGSHTLSLTVSDGAGRTVTANQSVSVLNLPPLTASFTSPASGATVSGSATIGMADTGASGSSTFTLAIDGTTVSTQTVSGASASYAWDTTKAANGNHTLSLTVSDGAGRTVTANQSVSVLNLPPLTASFTSPASGATVSGSATIGMADTGASGSSTFILAIDGTTVSTQTVSGASASYAWDTTKVANGSHTLSLTVNDGAGRSVTANQSVTVNNLPPLTGSFTSPASGAIVSGSTTIAMADTGASGSSTFTLAIDGATVSTQTVSGSSASYAWDTTTVANGGHTLNVTVSDGAGRTVTASQTVTVSTPVATFTASLTYPATNATVGGNQTVGMATTATWGKSKTFTLTVDGAVITSQTITGTTLWYTWNTKTVADGSRTLALAVTYNGATAKMSIPVTVKNGTAPVPSPLTASFTSPAAGATVTGSTTVGMASSGGASGSHTFNLQWSGPTAVAPVSQTVAGTTASYAWDTTKVANGSYSLSTTVTDAAGATATATRTVTVSNPTITPLTASFTSPADSATVSGTATVATASAGGVSGSRTFSLSFSGPSAVAAMSQTVAGTTASFLWNTAAIANGTYTLTLSVTDAAGTKTTATRTLTVSNAIPTASFTATIRYPANGATVGGTQTVGISTTATWGTSKIITLSVDGTVITSQTITGTTLWYSWNTKGTANGAHTLTVTVTNSTGTAKSSIGVTVKN